MKRKEPTTSHHPIRPRFFYGGTYAQTSGRGLGSTGAAGVANGGCSRGAVEKAAVMPVEVWVFFAMETNHSTHTHTHTHTHINTTHTSGCDGAAAAASAAAWT